MRKIKHFYINNSQEKMLRALGLLKPKDRKQILRYGQMVEIPTEEDIQSQDEHNDKVLTEWKKQNEYKRNLPWTKEKTFEYYKEAVPFGLNLLRKFIDILHPFSDKTCKEKEYYMKIYSLIVNILHDKSEKKIPKIKIIDWLHDKFKIQDLMKYVNDDDSIKTNIDGKFIAYMNTLPQKKNDFNAEFGGGKVFTGGRGGKFLLLADGTKKYLPKAKKPKAKPNKK